MNANELMGYSRLWKFEGGETFEEAQDLLKRNSYANFPLEIHARVLEPG